MNVQWPGPSRVSRMLALAAALAVGSCGGPSAPAERLEVRTDSGSSLRFLPDRLVAPPHIRLSLTFRNTSTEPHNLTFLLPLDARTEPIVQPATQEVVEFETPAPGSYRFICTIHESMGGVLLVD